MKSITSFIEEKLKLKVNRYKSKVDRPWRRTFRGFSFTWDIEPKVRIPKESISRMKRKVREITARKVSISMEYRIKILNRYLVGWCGYFALADTHSIFKNLDSWIRRRLRMCLWKAWKLPRTKARKLKALGVPSHKAYEWSNTRKSYWRISKSPYYTEPLEIPTGIPKGLKVYNYAMNLCVIILIKPPYTDRFVRWCEGTGANHSLQLNFNQKKENEIL